MYVVSLLAPSIVQYSGILCDSDPSKEVLIFEVATRRCCIVADVCGVSWVGRGCRGAFVVVALGSDVID